MALNRYNYKTFLVISDENFITLPMFCIGTIQYFDTPLSLQLIKLRNLNRRLSINSKQRPPQ